jgi:hypothetical protein
MASTKRVEPLDELAAEMLRLTPEENEALWRVRERNRMGPHEYLEFLLAFATQPRAQETIQDDIEPFEL